MGMIRFTFRLNTLGCIRALLFGEKVRYAYITPGAQLLMKAKLVFFKKEWIRKIDYDLIVSTKNIRKDSFRYAARFVDSVRSKGFESVVGHGINILPEKFLDKVVFERMYSYIEFNALQRRYQEERESIKRKDIKNNFLSCEKVMRNNREIEEVIKKVFAPSISELLLLLSTPLVLIGCIPQIQFKNRRKLKNSIICDVDSDETLNMFREIFSHVDDKNLYFVSGSKDINSRNMPNHMLYSLDIMDFFLILQEYQRILRLFITSPTILAGSQVIFLCYLRELKKAVLTTVKASESIFITFEHHTLASYLRNYMLTRTGNISIFFCLNAYVMPMYCKDEAYINYEVYCAGGNHIQKHYELRFMQTRTFLKTGSFASHYSLCGDLGQKSGLGKYLQYKHIKDSADIIVFLSAGICDYTYQQELKMTALVSRVAKETNALVIVRLKPVQPEVKYENFYSENLECHPRILMTSSEINLFEFINLNCLFITSYSTSAYDVAQAGAQVLFVNVLDDREYQEPLIRFPSILVEETEALTDIKEWIYDINDKRKKHSVVLKEFKDYIFYSSEEYCSYLHKVRSLLNPYCKAIGLV